MEVLIACDLEGVNFLTNVEGERLVPGHEMYDNALLQAVKEVNAVATAAFDAGATKVVLWDNHGKGYNLDMNLIDKRVIRTQLDKGLFEQMFFCKEHNFNAIIFIGYHTNAGTINGILAHTFSSRDYQYIKLNGKRVGEFECHTTLGADYGIAPYVFVGDDLACAQMKEFAPECETVITKYSNNIFDAEFRNNDELLPEIYNTTKNALAKHKPTYAFKFPMKIEVRYIDRIYALRKYQKLKAEGVDVNYGEDCFELVSNINYMMELYKFL